MKNLKTAIIATIVTALLICSCAYALPAHAEHKEHGEFFPQMAVVVGYEKFGNDWIIVCEDKDGELWEFYGEKEDAHLGNIFSLLLWDIGSEIQVIEAYYEGRMDDDTMLAWVCGDWE